MPKERSQFTALQGPSQRQNQRPRRLPRKVTLHLRPQPVIGVTDENTKTRGPSHSDANSRPSEGPAQLVFGPSSLKSTRISHDERTHSPLRAENAGLRLPLPASPSHTQNAKTHEIVRVSLEPRHPAIDVTLNRHQPELKLPRPAHRSPLSPGHARTAHPNAYEGISPTDPDGIHDSESHGQPDVSFRKRGQRRRRERERQAKLEANKGNKRERGGEAVARALDGASPPLRLPLPFTVTDSPRASTTDAQPMRSPALIVTPSGARRAHRRLEVQMRVEAGCLGLAELCMPPPPVPSCGDGGTRTMPSPASSSGPESAFGVRSATLLVLCRSGAGHTPFCLCG